MSEDPVFGAPAACDGACRLSRRAFLTQTMVTAAALALAACAGDPTAPEFSGTYTVSVADYASLATVGGVAVFNANGSPMALVRTGETSFLALSRVCPHQGGTIARSGSGFRCPRHGATFSIDGSWIGGERTSSMRAFAATFDASAGAVTIG